ncbi:MAG: ABC transporter ATP-binding protein, partial [Planctomycetota bacterium]
MADSIISAENLGKRYKLRHLARKPSTSLREAISYRFNRLAARLTSGSGKKPPAAVTAEEFWALQG